MQGRRRSTVRPPSVRAVPAVALATFSLALLAAPGARASGFLLHEQTAEALGRGGAVTAGTSEPAAVWFNPAALAFAPAQGASLSLAVARASTRFAPKDGSADTHSIPHANLVPALFAHGRAHDRLTLGLGFYAPFGLRVQWPEGWAGERNSLETLIWAAALNAVAAVRLSEWASVAGGASLVRGGAHFLLGLGPPVGGKAEFSGGAWGWAWNLALLLRHPSDCVRAALTYRSRVRLDFEGDADFSPQTNLLAGLFQDGPANATVTLPDIVTLAVAVRPLPRLELGAEVSRVRWSSFDHLEITFPQRPEFTIPIERGAGNPFTARWGGELWLPASAFALRAGVFFDQSSSDEKTLSPSAPDANRLGLSAGIGYLLGPAKIDVAYLYGHFFPAESNSESKLADAPPKGTYQTRLHALSLTLTVRR